MAVTISASLVSASSPRPVQIVVNGLTAGQEYTVSGTSGDRSSWPVPGGSGTAAGGQLVLVDNRSALNTPVTYAVTVAGATYTATPVIVAFADRYVLQSLDGQTTARIRWNDNGDPRELSMQSTVFEIPGRARPAVRFAAAGDGGGELVVSTSGPETANLRALLQSGRPLVLRTDGILPHTDAVALLLPTGGAQRIAGATLAYGDTRRWTIPYLLVDDPEPSAALSAFTWDDFDTAMASRTWSDFDGLFASSTWDQFDTYDWDQL